MQYFLTLIMNNITILKDEQNFDLFQKSNNKYIYYSTNLFRIKKMNKVIKIICRKICIR